MTTLREAAQQALEALEDHAKQYPHMQKGYTVDAITAIRDALAQEEQEPVAWRYALDASVEGPRWIYSERDPAEWRDPDMANWAIELLYTHPPRRTGLPHCERSCEANAFQIEIRRLKAELAAEREACADICDQHASVEGIAQRCAAEIRKRNKT
jgi:hypothetical protein